MIHCCMWRENPKTPLHRFDSESISTAQEIGRKGEKGEGYLDYGRTRKDRQKRF